MREGGSGGGNGDPKSSAKEGVKSLTALDYSA